MADLAGLACTCITTAHGRYAHGHAGRTCFDYRCLGPPPAAPRRVPSRLSISTRQPNIDFPRHTSSSSSPLRCDTCRRNGRIDEHSCSLWNIAGASASSGASPMCHRVASHRAAPRGFHLSTAPSISHPHTCRAPTVTAAPTSVSTRIAVASSRSRQPSSGFPSTDPRRPRINTTAHHPMHLSQ